MASTNKTTALALSQFVDTDKPTILGDYNHDMAAIDGEITSVRNHISNFNTAIDKAVNASTNATTLARSVLQRIEDAESAVAGIRNTVAPVPGQIEAFDKTVQEAVNTVSQVRATVSSLDVKVDSKADKSYVDQTFVPVDKMPFVVLPPDTSFDQWKATDPQDCIFVDNVGTIALYHNGEAEHLGGTGVYQDHTGVVNTLFTPGASNRVVALSITLPYAATVTVSGGGVVKLEGGTFSAARISVRAGSITRASGYYHMVGGDDIVGINVTTKIHLPAGTHTVELLMNNLSVSSGSVRIQGNWHIAAMV